MELWIRSQDKKYLVKVENIRCWYETQIAVNVKTSFNNVDYVVVGEYETKERALEVLDEIQNMLNATIFEQKSNSISYSSKQIAVYEMPND